VLPHGASSKEKAILTWGLSVFKTPWPFIPALPNGAFWLFHVMGTGDSGRQSQKYNSIQVKASRAGTLTWERN